MPTNGRATGGIVRGKESAIFLPDMTGLQFLAICPLVKSAEVSGRDLREWLAENGVKSSGPQFYQMMARLEDAGYVEGWYAQKELEHQVVNERRYRITADGLGAWERTRDFYQNFSRMASMKGTGEAKGNHGASRKKAVTETIAG